MRVKMYDVETCKQILNIDIKELGTPIIPAVGSWVVLMTGLYEMKRYYLSHENNIIIELKRITCED